MHLKFLLFYVPVGSPRDIEHNIGRTIVKIISCEIWGIFIAIDDRSTETAVLEERDIRDYNHRERGHEHSATFGRPMAVELGYSPEPEMLTALW